MLHEVGTILSTSSTKHCVMAKTVLLTFGERKKPLKIPVGSTDEIAFVKSRVTAMFGVGETVSILTVYCASVIYLPIIFLQSEIIIQRYSEDWSEYVDVEEGEGIDDKEKLKVLVVERPAREVIDEVS